MSRPRGPLLGSCLVCMLALGCAGAARADAQMQAGSPLAPGASRAAPLSASGEVPGDADTAVVAAMRRVYDAQVHKDAGALAASLSKEGMLFVLPDGVQRVTPAASAAMLRQCTVRRYAMDSVQTQPLAEDLLLLTVRLTWDDTCARRSPTTRVPVADRAMSAWRTMSVWRREGGAWKTVALAATPAAGPQRAGSARQ